MQHFRAFTRLVGTTLQGRGVSSGLADGVAVIHLPGHAALMDDVSISPAEAPAEVDRFEVVREDRYRVGAWRAGKALADRLSPEKVAERFEGIYTQSRGSRSSLAAVPG